MNPCVDSKDERKNQILAKWWPKNESDQQERECKSNLIKNDEGGVPGLYSHREHLSLIHGYDPVRGIHYNSLQEQTYPVTETDRGYFLF